MEQLTSRQCGIPYRHHFVLFQQNSFIPKEGPILNIYNLGKWATEISRCPWYMPSATYTTSHLRSCLCLCVCVCLCLIHAGGVLPSLTPDFWGAWLLPVQTLFYVQLGRAKLFFRNNWEAYLCRKVTSCIVDFNTASHGGASFVLIWCFPLYTPVFQVWGSLYRMSSQILISGSAFRETQTKTQAPASGNLDHLGEKTAYNFKKWVREKYIMSYKTSKASLSDEGRD